MSFLNELKKQKTRLKETETVVTSVDGRRYVVSNNEVIPLASTYGFVVDTKPDNVPVMIVDHLYVGSQDCAVASVMAAYAITHVLSLGVRADVGVDCKFVPCLDIPETVITPILRESLPYLKRCVEGRENVLVHCNAGVSRTAAVAIAYLMQYKGMQLDAAYSLVKTKRPASQPNAGFRKQLQCMKPGELV